MNLDKQKVSKLTLLIRSIRRTFLYYSKSNFFVSEGNGNNDKPLIHKAFIINLDRQPVRWKKFKREARLERTTHRRKLLTYCERISAIDGAQLSPAELLSPDIETKYDLEDHYFVDPDPRLTQIIREKNVKMEMSRAEIAVAMSHLKVWRKIVAEKIPYTLIFEDDIIFEDDFADRANQAWSELPKPDNGNPAFDILYFSYDRAENGVEKQQHSNNLFKPLRGLWWLSAYVISLECAQKLLKMLPIAGPVDLWMNLQFPILDVYATKDSIIGQRRDWKSDNEYSILPLLTRAGIHLDETSKRSTGRKPIFAIGMNKTATTSLHFALTSLGYKSCHFFSHEFSDITGRLIDNGEHLPYEAYTDVDSVVVKFKELDRQYPDAAFILTTRDLDSWLDSRARHIQRNRMENAAGAGHTWTEQAPQAWKAEREQHHKAVFDHFKDRPGKLLVLDICGGDEWEPLCNFLGCEVPEQLFPHVDPLIKLASFSRNQVKKVALGNHKSKMGEFDNLPWVDKPRSWSRFVKSHIGEFGTRTGSFAPEYTDNFEAVNSDQWKMNSDTFGHNLARFKPENISLISKGGLSLELKAEQAGSREYTAASIHSKPSHLFGRFEAEIKPTKASGIVTGLFLYRYDPWQEIDLEFFGKDTTRIMANVYYNPGEDGTEANEGIHGTPVVIDLGFDAADDFHRYAIEWDPEEIRWFVDDQLVHVRKAHVPSPIPDLPMRCFFNIWPPLNMKRLTGDLDEVQLPAQSHMRSYLYSSWVAPVIEEAELALV